MGKPIALLTPTEFVNRALRYRLVSNSPEVIARSRREFTAYREVRFSGGTRAKAQQELDTVIARGDYDKLLSYVEPVVCGLKALLDIRPSLGAMREIASDSSFAPSWDEHKAGSQATRMVIIKNPPLPQRNCDCKYPEHMPEFNPSGFLKLSGFYLRVARLQQKRMFELGFIVDNRNDGFKAISIDYLGNFHCYGFTVKLRQDACMRMLLDPTAAESAIWINQEHLRFDEAFAFRESKQFLVDHLPQLGSYLDSVGTFLAHEH